MMINPGQSEIYNVQDLNKRLISITASDVVSVVVNGVIIKCKNIKVARLGAKSIILKNENTSAIDVNITEE